MADETRPKCAIFGIYNAPEGEAAQLTYYGLHALQHRGQESSGIATLSRAKPYELRSHKNNGLVLDVFDPQTITRLGGIHAVGHNRYSTAGNACLQSLCDVQPLTVNYRGGDLALAHNGNLSNAKQLRSALISRGILFQGTADTELILHLMSLSNAPADDTLGQLIEALSACQGAYSLVVMSWAGMFAVRDPNGFRPLVIGKLGNSIVFASETCAFDLIGAQFVREVSPGEILWVGPHTLEHGLESQKGVQSVFLPQRFGLSPCVFEHIYFSRPDSVVFGQSVHEMRMRFGAALAKEHPVPTLEDRKDGTRIVVIAVPDSSNTAALGYVKECQDMGYACDYEIGLIRNHYVGRTFISPNQNARELKVRCKFNVLGSVVKNNIVVMVDDSIVRGTTSKQLIKMVRLAGAKEVHFRVSSPPVVSPCFYGMDFPSHSELLANRLKSTEEMRDYLGADSLAYLSEEGLKKAVISDSSGPKSYCFACFNTNYPVPISSDALSW